jgi:hypothetical protein
VLVLKNCIEKHKFVLKSTHNKRNLRFSQTRRIFLFVALENCFGSIVGVILIQDMKAAETGHLFIDRRRDKYKMELGSGS